MTLQSALNALFESGRAVDIGIAVSVGEFVVATWRQRRRGAKLNLVFALLPGVLLMLALRAALTGAGVAWVAVFLAASFPIHLIDLARRRVWSRHAP
jgi:hypothetical protein